MAKPPPHGCSMLSGYKVAHVVASLGFLGPFSNLVVGDEGALLREVGAVPVLPDDEPPALAIHVRHSAFRYFEVGADELDAVLDHVEHMVASVLGGRSGARPVE